MTKLLVVQGIHSLADVELFDEVRSCSMPQFASIFPNALEWVMMLAMYNDTPGSYHFSLLPVQDP